MATTPQMPETSLRLLRAISPALSAPAEALLLVTANTEPGTNPEDLGQRLADAVVHLPAPAVAAIGTGEVPADIREHARKLAERQGMADGAADLVMYFVRLWLRPGPELPAHAIEIAIACRDLWEERLRGVGGSGLTQVTCLPATSPEAWFRGALRCTSLATTANAPAGLIPDAV
ncbi:hypothetical protein [Streptomyces mirabilis]|uniref:hypothetical protein n=1 Tax=Streptomyces mirabilis TaxID=68239 RepID=UPI00167D00D5|nr:hypothetical protein [Streptomyces mirabilis]GHD49034.1 hypothetical protein GCM10010317_027310 [Streptomyces mirabilis]